MHSITFVHGFCKCQFSCCRTALEETKELQRLRKRPNGVSVEDLATIKTKQKEQSVEVVYYTCSLTHFSTSSLLPVLVVASFTLNVNGITFVS